MRIDEETGEILEEGQPVQANLFVQKEEEKQDKTKQVLQLEPYNINRRGQLCISSNRYLKQNGKSVTKRRNKIAYRYQPQDSKNSI